MAVGLLGEITHMLELVEQAGTTAPAAAWSHTAGAAYCVVMSAYGALLQGQAGDGAGLRDRVAGRRRARRPRRRSGR